MTKLMTHKDNNLNLPLQQKIINLQIQLLITRTIVFNLLCKFQNLIVFLIYFYEFYNLKNNRYSGGSQDY